MSISQTNAAPLDHAGPSRLLIFAFAVSCGASVANVFYAQPLVAEISESFGISIATGSFIIMLMLLGYVIGLLLLVPLGDLVENKKLIQMTLGGSVLCLIASTLAPRAEAFFATSLLLGLSAVGTQMMMPMVAHLTPEHRRGQVVGTVLSGALFGILFARPVATLVAGMFGWRAVYVISALIMCAVLALMSAVLPRRVPVHSLSYGQLIKSLWSVLITTPSLQRRAAYQAMFFAAFNLFYTSTPLLLEEPPFSLSRLAMSAFLLSGAIGAAIAPVAGRLADKGHSRGLTGAAIVGMGASFVLLWFGDAKTSLAAIVVAGIVLDAGTQTSLVTGQRAIYTLAPQIRSRLNALYMSIFFFGGAIGSAMSGAAVTQGGAGPVVAIGIGITVLALLLYATEFRGKS